MLSANELDENKMVLFDRFLAALRDHGKMCIRDSIITVKEGADIRRTLFDFCAKHSWYILMITPLGISLEDVFIQLTGGSPIEQARALAERRRRLAASKKEENQQKGDQ